MHDIKAIRENPAAIDAALALRGAAPVSATLNAIDEQRRALITKAQTIQERRNALSKEIGAAMSKGNTALAEQLKAEVASYKTALPEIDAELAEIEAQMHAIIAALPNSPLESVPHGKDEHDNVLKTTFGTPKTFGFTPKEHFELGETLGLMDFEAAARMSGARFVVLKGTLARLERALAQFMLDTHVDEFGYTEVNPPILVKNDAMFGTAQLPKFKEDQFGVGTYDEGTFAPSPEFWLIPTAEVSLTNLVREQILAEAALPLRFTACTPCFRAEAGSAGRDTRGMIRQHQFSKVELVSITTPEVAISEHDRMLSCAEAILQKLQLPYRVVTLCTGDMGFAAQKTYDIDVWLPGQNQYREISSCSVCGDFQARRMNARYRTADGKVQFVHTLNGSGLAVGRTLVAVMENYQNADGSITIPDVLKPYMGAVTRVE